MVNLPTTNTALSSDQQFAQNQKHIMYLTKARSVGVKNLDGLDEDYGVTQNIVLVYL